MTEPLLPTEPHGVWVDDRFYPDSRALFDELVRFVAWDERMRSRKTASFGVPYNYSGITYPKAAIPDPVSDLMVRLPGRLGFLPNNCLANYYPDGEASMGFHADATDGLAPGTGIAIVSLGAERAITFQSMADRQLTRTLVLRSGSLLYMTAETQRDWKHAIPPQAKASGRISLTFRRVVAE